ncbi:RNA-directed DNA polymerase [Aeromonas dhakensis]|uniref:RNA-directed DNA polymerase n=1 Tax=Aeromonas dhakensis TaxID=196024 RepID=UPI0038D02910
MLPNPIKSHRDGTKTLAESLTKSEIYHWLIKYGYFPESYILPPCFEVSVCPAKPKVYFKVKKKFNPKRTECINVHFPKSELTDRTFGIIHPEIHNDIAYHIARNWKTMLKAIFPAKSRVTSYSFPLPIDAKEPGRLSYLRSGRLIYEFIGMVDDDIASMSYRYSHIVKADIKSFYPSIYTHSIAWAIHGKSFIRKPVNMYNTKLVGNRLDKLFQNANDGCTNGIPIGPVVSDLIAEIIAAGVDVVFSQKLELAGIECEVVRFKDDYRILVKSESDGKSAIKHLQEALKEFNLELNDEKTNISTLPEGLFREWVSKYHAVHPRKRKMYSWKHFRELYLSVIRIDKECPNTGVIDRFLADIIGKNGQLKVHVGLFNLQKVLSMLLMLGTLRVKAFPKIIAILESVLRSPFGFVHLDLIYEHMESFLSKLTIEENRNKYLISWVSYFLVSNGLDSRLVLKPKLKDAITKSILNNRGAVFKDATEFKLFTGCRTVAKRVSMLEHLDVFNPPKPT